MSKLSVVIPSFNEAENVENLVERIHKALNGISYEIIFVDDSTDNTPEVINDVIKKNPNVRLKHRTEERGLSSAVIEGFKMAEGDYIAVMDADLQHPPEILHSMYKCLESGADICIPSRFVPGGSDGGLGPYRKFVSAVARYLGKIMLPCLRKITDPTSGLFMFRHEVIKDADLQPIGWKIMIEVLAIGTYTTVEEIPYRFKARPAGESKLTTKVTLQYLQQLMSLTKRAKKR